MVAVDGAGGDDVLAFVHEGQLSVVAHCGEKLAAMKILILNCSAARREEGASGTETCWGFSGCLNSFYLGRSQTAKIREKEKLA